VGWVSSNDGFLAVAMPDCLALLGAQHKVVATRCRRSRAKASPLRMAIFAPSTWAVCPLSAVKKKIAEL